MSIFDLVDKKIAIECRTEKDARRVIDTAIANGLACNWNKGDNTGFETYGGCVCYMFERSEKHRTYDMYRSGYDWADINGYELIEPEDIEEIGGVYEEVKPSSCDVFTLIL